MNCQSHISKTVKLHNACGSSRLAPREASPSTEPDVRLFRIRLLAKLIVQQLSVDTDKNSWTCQRIFLEKVVKPVPIIASPLASSVKPVEQTSTHFVAEVVQAVKIVSNAVVMEITHQNLVQFGDDVTDWQHPHFFNTLVNFPTFPDELLPAGFPLHSEPAISA